MLRLGQFAQELITLLLLYSSLARAMAGARASLIMAPEGSDYHTELKDLVCEIALLTLQWQDRYRIAYGGTGYLVQYESQLNQAVTNVESLREVAKSDHRLSEVIEQLISSWKANPYQELPDERRASYPIPGRAEFLSAILDLSRGSATFLESWRERLDRVETMRNNLWNFFRKRRMLGDYLETRLPVLAEVQRYVDGIAEQAEEVSNMLVGVADLQAIDLEWFAREARYFRDKSLQLNQNSYSSAGTLSQEEMDKRKTACNNQLALYIRIAEYLGVPTASHLDIYWY